VDATGGSEPTGSKRRRDGVCGVCGVRDENGVCGVRDEYGVCGERSSMDSCREKDPRRLLVGELSRFTSIPMKVLGAQEASIQGLYER
jgi:hypothetical protein